MHRRVLVHVPHGLHTHTNLRSNVPLHTRHYAAERLEDQKMSSPNQPQSAPASGPAVDTRQGRGSKDKSGGGAISGALKKITSKLAWVMAGIIFAGIFLWGVAEVALNGPEPSVPFAGLTGHFSFDRFLLQIGRASCRERVQNT